jgi:hypothetical protein
MCQFEQTLVALSISNGSNHYSENVSILKRFKRFPKRRNLFFTFFILCFSCSQFNGESNSFSLEKETNHTKKIKLRGYYLREVSIPDGKALNIIFFYENGVLMSPGSFEEKQGKVERYLRHNLFMSKVKDLQVSWGLYTIKDDSISFEKWYHGGGPTKILQIRKGIILNDTTFLIGSVFRSNGTEKTLVKEYYYFKKFNPKPDSTNQFIK